MTTGMSHCAWLDCLCSFSLQSFQSFVYILGSNPLPAVVCKGLFTIYNSSTLSFEIPCLCVCPLLAVHRTRVGVRRQAVALALSFPHVGPWDQTQVIRLGRSSFIYGAISVALCILLTPALCPALLSPNPRALGMLHTLTCQAYPSNQSF